MVSLPMHSVKYLLEFIRFEWLVIIGIAGDAYPSDAYDHAPVGVHTICMMANIGIAVDAKPSNVLSLAPF